MIILTVSRAEGACGTTAQDEVIKIRDGLLRMEIKRCEKRRVIGVEHIDILLGGA